MSHLELEDYVASHSVTAYAKCATLFAHVVSRSASVEHGKQMSVSSFQRRESRGKGDMYIKSCMGGRFLSYRLQRATKEENQPNAVEGALAPPNVAVRVQ